MLKKAFRFLLLRMQSTIVRGYFDSEFYLRTNPDVVAAAINPTEHFLRHGDADNRSPFEGFDCADYCTKFTNRMGLTSLAHAVIFNKGYIVKASQKHSNAFMLSMLADNNNSKVEKIEKVSWTSNKLNAVIEREFDAEFYLKSYPDVQGPHDKAFRHYMNFGWKEGRKPCDWFDRDYYLEQNPGCCLNSDAFAHYLDIGMNSSHANRRICNQRGYIAYYFKSRNFYDPVIYGQVLREKGIEAQATLDHFIDVGIHLGLRSSTHFNSGDLKQTNLDACEQFIRDNINHNTKSQKLSLTKKIYSQEHYSDKEYDVIVPIYDGLEQTKLLLSSLIKSKNNTKYKVVLVYDDGPDDKLLEYVKKFTIENSARFDLIINESNLGFVKTVNNAFFKFTRQEKDVVILNADTIVSDHWLDRLTWHADYNYKVATVTPFSNNGTICNFPNFEGFSSEGFAAKVTSVSDALHNVNAGISVQVPTGVGFCMFVSRDVLNEIGGFNEAAFGLGYGEENDLCRRAEKSGFINLHALDLFVLHEGGVSFASKNIDKSLHAKNLLNLHPEYNQVVLESFAFDWAKGYKLRGFAEWLNQSNAKIKIYLTHGLGGGTDKFVEHNLDINQINLIVSPKQNKIQVKFIYEEFENTIDLDMSEYVDLLDRVSISKIEVHHRLGWSDNILHYSLRSCQTYDVVVHDFHWLCARLYGLKSDGKNCGITKDLDECLSCVSMKPSGCWVADPLLLRQETRNIFNGANKVICSSRYVKNKMVTLLGINNVVIDTKRWRKISAEPQKDRKLIKKTVRKGVILGALNEHKGLRIVEKMLPLFSKGNISIVHIGSVIGDAKLKMKSTGVYNEKYVIDLIDNQAPDFIWLPSVAEETYSFTLSEALATKYPIFVNNVGSLPERARQNEAVAVIDVGKTPQNIFEQMLEYLQ